MKRFATVLLVGMVWVLLVTPVAHALQYWTYGSQGVLHDPAKFTIATAANLKTDSNTVRDIHVSSIYVDRTWDVYVETGFAIDNRRTPPVNRLAFADWSQQGWPSQLREEVSELPWGVWRYFEINGFQPLAYGYYEWRANIAGLKTHKINLQMSSGTSAVYSERFGLGDTNYLSASNLVYRDRINGNVYMFNDLEWRPGPAGDPGFGGQWGSWWSGKRDFRVIATP